MRYLFLILILFSCVENEHPSFKGMCVVYNGYSQMWVKDLKQMPDNTLVAKDMEGDVIIITNYSTYECY